MRRAGALAALGALALSLWPAPAAAEQQSQDRLINTPAESFAMSPGGVDMRTGRYVYNETDLSIGGEGGLTLARTMTQNIPGHGNPFGNLSHNWDITVSELRINYDNPQQGGNDYRIFVNFGGRSQTFKGRAIWAGFGQESSGPAATLTYTGDRAGASVVYTYTAPDGSVAVFRALGTLGNGGCSHLRRCANIAQLTEPDGTVLTFDYAPNESGIAGGTERLRSVTSSRGYALLLEGTENRVTRACIVNLSLGALPASCPANALASSTYAYSDPTVVHDPSSPVIFTTRRLTGATGPDNATSAFTYANGGNTIGFVRPGESAAWQTLSVTQMPDEQYVMQDIVGMQSFADGGSYEYLFGTTPYLNNNPNPTIAGGAYRDALGHTVLMPYAFPRLHHLGTPPDQCYTPPCAFEPPDDYQNWVYQQTPGPVAVTDPLGRTTTFNYCDPVAMANLPANEPNRCVVLPLVSYTDPEGAVTELEYDGARNISKVTRRPRPGSTLAPLITSAVYDIAHPRSQTKPLSTTDARGNVTTFTYAPEHGGLLTQTGPAVNGVAPQTRHGYALRQARRWDGAPAGPPIWLRTATSLCRTSAATGNPASPCAIAGDEVLTTYDYGPDTGPNTLLLRGQAVTATDGGIATTLRTCYAYDALGRKISETQPNANLASCPANPPTTALPYTTSTRYDAGNRVTGTISPDPDGAGWLPFLAVRNSYDPAGRLIKVESGRLTAWQSEAVAPSAWPGFTAARSVETQYDMLSRKVRAFAREGGSGPVLTMTEYSYDLAGRLTCAAVRMNTHRFAFTGIPDACAPTNQGDEPADRISRNVYDAAGQRVQLREGVGSASSGNNVEAAEATWAYNLAGQITTIIDGNGNRAELRYDSYGRQDRWTFPSTTRPASYSDATQTTALASAGSINAADYEEYGYDPNGNRTSLRKRDGSTLSYSYDALNRMTLKTVPERPSGPQALTVAQTRDVQYGYDLRNLQLYARFDSATGNGVTSVYDGFGRVTSSRIVMGAADRMLSYAYDRNGNRIRVTHPDGTYFTYEYDQSARLNFIRENGTTSGIGVLATIGYAADGPPGAVVRSNGSITAYGYDPVGRPSLLLHDLTGSTGDVTWTYLRNPASQIISQVRNNDSYAWAGHYAVNRTYTANGLNQYSAVGGGTFGYDANGNLTSSPGPHAGETLSYVYDIENRLVGSASSTGASPSVTLFYDPLGRLFSSTVNGTPTEFLYDGDALVGEYAGTNLLRRYVHAVGADVPVVWYEGAGLTDRRWLHADHQGSIVAITNSTGTLIATNRYDEYGIPEGTNSGRFQYTGQIWLSELGLYHYKARLYSPYQGRFLQSDPIGYEDQYNLYAYVGNDPINHVDPDGMQLSSPNDPRISIVLPVIDYAKGIAKDLGDLGGAILRGDFQYAFAGMPPTLGGGMSSAPSGVTSIVNAVRSANTGERAAARAAQIHAELDAIAQSRRTTAVLQTDRGAIVSAGGRDLTPAQVRALQAGERVARSPGAHAESTAISQARSLGARPQALGTTRPMCPTCMREIIESGGTITSTTTAVWQSTIRRLLPF